MKNAYEVLQQKQTDIARIRKEIESLNIVASLLSDEGTSGDPDQSEESSQSSASADNLFSSVTTSESGFWDSLKRAATRAN